MGNSVGAILEHKASVVSVRACLMEELEGFGSTKYVLHDFLSTLVVPIHLKAVDYF